MAVFKNLTKSEADKNLKNNQHEFKKTLGYINIKLHKITREKIGN